MHHESFRGFCVLANHHQRSLGGTNLEHARSHNRRAVLEVVRRAGVISRADIARQTSLTLQTISNIVQELEETGLLIAGSTVRNGRGQPSVPYSINPKGGWTIGIHIARHAVFAVLADLTGKPVATLQRHVQPNGPEQAAPIVEEVIATLQSEANVENDLLLGVGMALPTRFDLGPISTAGPTGLPGWNDAAARAAFEKRLGMPLLIENDAVAAAIGERLYGAAKDIENFVLLFLDEGLGAGLFANGQVFKGAFSNAGEIGHMVVEPNGRDCPCGNKGCLERYVSLRAAYECVSETPDAETPERINALDDANPDALAVWFKEAGLRLASATNILESVLDPETIIIGGLASADIVQKLIVAANPLPVSVSARAGRILPRLIAGSAGPFSTAFGAAALPVFDEMNPRFDVLLKG
jgi:predicted NBD/HSP70 family sugar kinase